MDCCCGMPCKQSDPREFCLNQAGQWLQEWPTPLRLVHGILIGILISRAAGFPSGFFMKIELAPKELLVIVWQMLCEKIHTQLPLGDSAEKSAGSLVPPKSSAPSGETESLAAVRRKERNREYYRQYRLK